MPWLSTAALTVAYNTINKPLHVGAGGKMHFKLVSVVDLG